MQLLISVVSTDEATEALAGGADILDVKNPAEGSLGANLPRIIRQIRMAAPTPSRLSVAIGDMPNLPGTASLAALGAAACGADYIKVGLRWPGTAAEAIFMLREIGEAVSDFPAVAVIAAGYADADRAHTIDPRLLPRIAGESGVAGWLLDTAVKDGRGLFDFLTPEELRTLAVETHARGLLLALAGALRAEDLRVARDIGADVAGVRSAACRDNLRAGPLEAARVRQLLRVIRE